MAHGNTGRKRPDLVARNAARVDPNLPSKIHESEWNIWRGMVQRCHNENAKDFPRYGGRGVRVCDRWRESFENFFADMGPRPSRRHSIDRVDNDGGYSPENCRWRTWSEQQRNRRSNTLITFRGETLPLVEWSERTGIGRVLIRHRLNAGWSVEDALTRPVSRAKNYRYARRLTTTDKETTP